MDQSARGHRRKPKFMTNILDDIYYQNEPLCQIIPTSTKKKENMFDVYRPQPRTCLDYNISETDTKVLAGNTRIHVKETRLEYTPALTPPPKKRTKRRRKYFSGGPPQWEFVEEKWRREQEEKQKDFHGVVHEFMAKRRKEKERYLSRGHREVWKLSGPSWYQELSPKQINTVNNLKNCILKDLADGTIINTQENIGELGLVLRPNHRHIKKALKNCCKCPVEFLLVLYQLIDPNRTKYSINDRLLLSAVVHLTMMDTLKELHIRIPSPPKASVVTKKIPKKKKRVHYKSPYLIPFTFQKEPRKFVGKFKNKHILRPKSPYFCYLAELRKMKEDAMKETKIVSVPDTSQGSVDEIEEELMVAQAIYESLVDFRPVPVLLKPSKYTICDNLFQRAEFLLKQVLEEEEDVEEDQDNTSCCYEDETEVSKVSESCDCSPKDACTCVSVESKCYVEESENCCNDVPQRPCYYTEVETNQQTCGCGNEAVRHDTSGRNPRSEICQNEEAGQSSLCENRKEKAPSCNFVQNAQYTKEKQNCGCGNNAVRHDTPGRNPPSEICQNEEAREPCFYENRKEEARAQSAKEKQSRFCPFKPNMKPKKDESETEEKSCKHAKDLAVYNEMYRLIRPGKKKPCTCKEKFQKFIDTPLCQCKKCRKDRKKKNITHLITGMAEPVLYPTVPIIDRVIEGKPCDCLKKYERKIAEIEKQKKADRKKLCNCHEKMKMLLEKPQCQCEKCQENRRQLAAKFIIGGTKTYEDDPLHIIEGISMGRPCECVKAYEKRVREYEEFEKSRQLLAEMKNQDQKFMIGGVASTPEGPKYVITGMRPPIDCICAKNARQEAKERHMQEIMPHIPPGRVQYGILGVKETSGGNVYVLNSALPIDDCDCMAVYQSFKEQHRTCIQLYEDYLSKMRDEYNTFMDEMLPPASSRRSSMVSERQRASTYETEETEKQTEEIISEPKTDIAVEEEKAEEEEKEEKSEPVLKQVEEKISQASQEIQKPCVSCKNVCTGKSMYCNCGNPIYSMCCDCGKLQTADCAQCTCGGQVIACVDCTCGVEEEEESVEEEIKLKRFFIYNKILCDYEWQMDVLKKALESMAEDGFPLAKLPECYKLPHFTLWMQMRCKHFWTKQDQYDHVNKSKDLWRHCDQCTAWTTYYPEMGISKRKAKLLDWSKADYCRQLINDYLEKFYRRIKQNRINFGREFFPTTFPYEFPFKTWRDCYFAYTPTKEEEVLARRVWQRFDVKYFSEMQRFCH